MPYNKLFKIAKHYGLSPEALIKKWYLEDTFSGDFIAEKIYQETGISITSRSIHRQIKLLGISRDKTAARNIGIQSGRIDYDHLKKPIKAKELRKGISLAIRYKILKRDAFRCVLCGQNATRASLVVDHIISIVRGGDNSEENLRTLCSACNHGKMIYENEK